MEDSVRRFLDAAFDIVLTALELFLLLVVFSILSAIAVVTGNFCTNDLAAGAAFAEGTILVRAVVSTFVVGAPISALLLFSLRRRPIPHSGKMLRVALLLLVLPAFWFSFTAIRIYPICRPCLTCKPSPDAEQNSKHGNNLPIGRQATERIASSRSYIGYAA